MPKAANLVRNLRQILTVFSSVITVSSRPERGAMASAPTLCPSEVLLCSSERCLLKVLLATPAFSDSFSRLSCIGLSCIVLTLRKSFLELAPTLEKSSYVPFLDSLFMSALLLACPLPSTLPLCSPDGTPPALNVLSALLLTFPPTSGFESNPAPLSSGDEKSKTKSVFDF